MDAFKLSTLTWMRLDHPSRKETYTLLHTFLSVTRSKSAYYCEPHGQLVTLLFSFVPGNKRQNFVKMHEAFAMGTENNIGSSYY